MKASELRLGNWVYDSQSKQNIIVDEIISYDDNTIDCKPFFMINGMDSEDCEPIKLTEEWMLRFGFEKLSHNHIWKKKTNANRGFNLEEADGYIQELVGFGVSDDSYKMVLIYVHQLQNLYFASTSEEL